jgi:hypothetical protein
MDHLADLPEAVNIAGGRCLGCEVEAANNCQESLLGHVVLKVI